MKMDTSRILQKGPEYLRKQMEREREATGRSAAERLAATKPEYIRNQQPLSSETVSNTSSSDQSQPAPSSPGTTSGENTNVVKRNSSKKRPDSLLLYRHKGELLKGSPDGGSKKLTKRTLLEKDKTSRQVFEKTDFEVNNSQRLTQDANSRDRDRDCDHERGATKPRTPVVGNWEETVKKPTTTVTTDEESVARKPRTVVSINQEGIGRKPLTAVMSNPEEAAMRLRTTVANNQENVARKPKTSGVARKPTDGGDLQDVSSKPPTITRSERPSRRNRVSRSHSDISSRYSRNFADLDAFFTYCGLDDDIIDQVGRANFYYCSEATGEELIGSGRFRSVSVVDSDDGFSQSSSNRSDGLQEDELPDLKNGKGPSVIERNARVIKWLYSCRNATQSGKTLRDLD